MARVFVFTLLAFTLISGYVRAGEISASKIAIKNIGKYRIEFPAWLKKEVGVANPGVGSGLTFKGYDNNENLLFYSITDRGINHEGPKLLNGNPTRIFEPANFSPFISLIKVTAKNAIIESVVKLEASGIPNVDLTKETPIDKNLVKIAYDPNGIDSEAIDIDSDGNFWIADEYLPSIIKFSKEGKILAKYDINNGLPEVLKHRMENRGIESLAITPNGKVFFMLESVLDINEQTKEKTEIIRLFEFDLETKISRIFAYPFDKSIYKSTSAVKIGDISAINNNQFLVIEQGKKDDNTMSNTIQLIDISEAEDISQLELSGKILESNEGQKYKSIDKKFIMELRDHDWPHEKLEGAAYIDEQTIAISNDNDFGRDIKTEKIHEYEVDLENKILFNKGKISDTKIEYYDTDRHSEIWIIKFDSSFLKN